MNENIIKYLRENKEKFSKEVLIEQLRKTGYAEGDILEGEKIVYNENVSAVASDIVPNKISFWNFKEKKVYTESSEKLVDFLFGLFSPILIGIISQFLFFIGSIVFTVFYFFSIFYLFNRRRFIAYGIIGNFVVGILVVIAIILSFGFMGDIF